MKALAVMKAGWAENRRRNAAEGTPSFGGRCGRRRRFWLSRLGRMRGYIWPRRRWTSWSSKGGCGGDGFGGGGLGAYPTLSYADVYIPAQTYYVAAETACS